MTRAIPIIPTILVLAAAGVMVWLGFWQLGRADEKVAMIAEFEAKASLSEIVEIGSGEPDLVYRSVRLDCPEPKKWQAVAGRNDKGQAGFAHRYNCHVLSSFAYFDGPGPTVITYGDIGWSRSAEEPDFDGGVVEGTLVRLGDGYKVVASEPIAGLEPLAKPDPNDLPNNHLAYAGQWFLFALTALLIYGFALRSRMKKSS